MPSKFPYFDFLIKETRKPDSAIARAFGHHVHWGYWEFPDRAEGTLEDVARAAESMTQKVCNAAKIKEGDSVLDVGCGFGGTISSLNERFSKLDLVGLNIEEIQLEIARKRVKPKKDNSIKFVCGDACHLPFKEKSFDKIIALESILHFPSRSRFFQEAYRVLKPGGCLTLTDFCPTGSFLPTYKILFVPSQILFNSLYIGKADTSCTLKEYKKIAQRSNLQVATIENITSNTTPTYLAIANIARWEKNSMGALFFDTAAKFARLEWIQYLLLSFVKK